MGNKQFKIWLIITIAYIIIVTALNIFYYLNTNKNYWFLITDVIGVLLIIITILYWRKK